MAEDGKRPRRRECYRTAQQLFMQDTCKRRLPELPITYVGERMIRYKEACGIDRNRICLLS